MATIQIKTNAPTKYQLVRQYFEKNLENFIAMRVNNYFSGEGTETFDEEGVLRLTIYLPISIDTETVHHKYNFLKQNFKFEEDKLAKTVFMSELGTKMRVKIVDK